MAQRTGANPTVRRGRRVTDAMLQHAIAIGRRATGVYVFPDNTIINIQAVSSTLVFDLQSDAGKPTPPLKEVTFAGGTKTKLPDEADPDYKKAVATWEMSKAAQFTRVLISEGVMDWPPEDEVLKWVGRGITNPEEIKYSWIAAKLWNDELSQDFIGAVMGLSNATEDGLEAAEDSFPSDDADGGQPQLETGSGVEGDSAEARQ